MKVRYWLEGARRAICRHSAHNVPSMPVGHVKTALSITLHFGQGERDREKEEAGNAGGRGHTNMGILGFIMKSKKKMHAWLSKQEILSNY